MSRRSERRARRETKRILGLPITWEDDPVYDEPPPAPPRQEPDDWFFNVSNPRPYIPSNSTDTECEGC